MPDVRTAINKYRNIRVFLDGITFDSKREAARYQILKLLERAGQISGLTVHPRFACVVKGVHVCFVVPDFQYCQDGEIVTEDVKGVETSIFRLKAKLMLACHGIIVRVVR